MKALSQQDSTDAERKKFIHAYYVSKLGSGILPEIDVKKAEDYLSSLTDTAREDQLAELKNLVAKVNRETMANIKEILDYFYEAFVKRGLKRIPEQCIEVATEEATQFYECDEIIYRGIDILSKDVIAELEHKSRNCGKELLIDFCKSLDVTLQNSPKSAKSYSAINFSIVCAEMYTEMQARACAYLRSAMTTCTDDGKKLSFLATEAPRGNYYWEPNKPMCMDPLIKSWDANCTPGNFQEMLRRQAEAATKDGIRILG